MRRGTASLNRAIATDRADHDWNLGGVTIGPDAHRDAPREVDPLDLLEKSVHKVLARLLTVGHDIDVRGLLLFEGGQDCVAPGRWAPIGANARAWKRRDGDAASDRE